jgi:hypothetical protein
MGNQQETDLAYLAGILDGEGCIHLSFRAGKTEGKGNFNRRVQITNTSAVLVDFVTEFLTTQEIPFYVQWNRHVGKNHRPYATIMLSKLEGIKKFLSALLPYLRIKKRQAELMLEFVDSRLQTFETAQRNSIKWSFTQRELDIAKAMRTLNGKGIWNLNDYTLNATAKI